MNSLAMTRKAKDALKFLRGLEEVTEEQGTRAIYLMFLASVHPNAVTFETLQEELAVTPQQVSRVTRGLTRINHRGAEGLDLLEVTFDVHNPRIKLVKLNASGVTAVQRLLSLWGA